MNCPSCNRGTLWPIAGTFGTGVFAPDGYEETTYEEGYQCERCAQCFNESDMEDQMSMELKVAESDDEAQRRIEIEDDQRCGECGSTEMGGCLYCKMD